MVNGIFLLADGIAESFRNNLIVENRYQMILDGLQVTLLITLCAAVLGTLLGGLVCWMRMSRRGWLQQVAKVYIDLMRGTPVLVLLMLMYYVVMAPIDATGIVVAIITFAMNAAAYISEMLRTSIQSIDRGQTEAGLALGFTKRQTLLKIVLPQVIRNVMPVYQGELISLLKGTSIVGYIAVADMTRASDLIRSRTFDAFFPLIVTAIIYFLAAWLIGLLLQSLVKHRRVKAAVAALLLLFMGLAAYHPWQGSGQSASQDETLFTRLAGKRVAVLLGSHQDLLVSQKAPDAILMRYNNMSDLINAVLKDKADVVCTDDLLKLVDRKHAALLDYVDAGEPPMPMGAVFRKGNTELQGDFNRFLKEIRDDGTYDRMLDRWFGSDNPEALSMPQPRGRGRLLRVGTYSGYPPFSFISHGRPAGLSMEMVMEWANRRDWRIDIQSMEGPSLFPAVQTGKVDVVIAGFNVTEERRKQVLFSDETCASHVGFFTKKGSTLFDGIAHDASQRTDTVPPVFKALKGKRVAVVIGSIQDMAATRYAPDADIIRLGSIADVLTALESRKVDVAVQENLTVIFNKQVARKVDTLDSGLPGRPVGACFRLGNTELQQDFNRFLEDIQRDGTYQKIHDRWSKADNPSALPAPRQRGTGRTLRVATYPGMPPFNFINAGKPSGLEVDILTEWANRRNWRLEFLAMDFASQIPAVQTGKADMAMGSITNTEERRKQVLFSDSYHEGHITIYTRKGELGILKSASQLLPEGEESRSLSETIFSGEGLAAGLAALIAVIGGGVWFFVRRKRAKAVPRPATRVERPSTDPLIRISHLRKQYGALDVLSDINVDIHHGEVISVIGPSGTGKSTFLRCLNLLEQPSGGSILIDGQDILTAHTDVPMLRRRMGMVFQSFNLFNGMSVLDNVCLAPMQLLRKSREEAEQKARTLLEMVGLAEREDAKPDELSGGQKQRVAIARALAMEPEILLFDEPTSALDPTMVSEVLGVMTRLAREGMTMIVVTHEMRFARQVSSRVLFFADGVVYEDGTPDQLFNHPQRELTRQFIRQIHESTFLIESEHFDWYAMMAQMEQFCQHYNVSRRQTESLLHVIDETMAILSSGNGVAALPGTRLTLSYAEQDDVLQFTVNSPQPVNPEMFLNGSDNIAATILRSYSSDISINGNDLRITI